MITIGEVSPEVKNRVVALFDRDAMQGTFDIKTIRTVVTGLALQTLNKKYDGAFGNGLTSNAADVLTDAQALELVAERSDNLQEYLELAREIYVEATINDVTSGLGEEAGKVAADIVAAIFKTSTPDATGNSLDVEASADNVVPGTPAPTAVCPICNTVHE